MGSVEIRFKVLDEDKMRESVAEMFKKRGWVHQDPPEELDDIAAELILHCEKNPTDLGFEVIGWG